MSTATIPSDSPSRPIDYILVPRAAIPLGQPLSFELFVKIGERYIKVANRDEPIDPDRINRYLEHEKDVLYIDRGSLERFMDEKFGMMFDLITAPDSPVAQRFDWFSRCLELGYVDLKIVRPHPDKFMRIEMLVDWSFNLFRKREVRKLLIRQIFKSAQHPLSKRAIFGTCFNLSLILDQSDCTPASFRSFFLGSLYRDFALVPHDERDPHTIPLTEMTAQQQNEFFEHPIKSMEILRSFNIEDDIIRAMIEQHHEQPRGNGYPRGLKRAETFQPAQYLGLADFIVSEHQRFKGQLSSKNLEEFIEHFKQAMPEENQKNLPLLIRAIKEIFD